MILPLYVSEIIQNQDKKAQSIKRKMSFMDLSTLVEVVDAESHTGNDLLLALIPNSLQRSKKITSMQDALSLVSKVFKVYVNDQYEKHQEEICSWVTPKQNGGTCYANAISCALHLAMKRIIGHEGGYPKFRDLRNEIIQKYGIDGANTEKVLVDYCLKYRLRVEKVGLSYALSAVRLFRPVVVSFHLQGEEWDAFQDFYKRNPKGILTKKDLEKTVSPLQSKKASGHAVVLIYFESDYLMFMNSWGVSWGDNGFFRVSRKGNVLGCKFYDVYWTLDDLKQSELQAYYKDEYSFGSPNQIGGKFYANAAASVLHLATKRIVGREGGYPKLADLKEELVELYETEGASTNNVLEKICPKYRLHVKEVSLSGAISAVTRNRPVVATFHLNGGKWDAFSDFFKKNPEGVLTKKDLKKSISPSKSEEGGHAVFLFDANSDCLMFMNSWGVSWGDNGSFRVSRNGNVLGCDFYDVYWTLDDLKRSELQAFERFISK